MKKRYAVLIILIAWLPMLLAAWDKDKPAATLSLRSSNPQILANNAALETAFNREHEFSTGGTTADQMHHKKGSARAYFQDGEPATRVDGTAFTAQDLGSLWFDTNATPDNLYYVLTATTPTWTKVSVSLIAEIIATANTWGAHQTFGAGFDLLGSTTSDINFGSGNFTVAGATGNTLVAGTFTSTGVATLGDGSKMATSAAPTADAELANKKYVDDIILVNGTATRVFTKYITGTLDADAETNVAHGVTAANILSVDVWCLSSDGNYYGKDHGTGPGVDNVFAVHYDANTVDIHGVGTNLRGQVYRIRINYTA